MGNILITQEGVETSTIQEGIRDKSLFSFYEMINKAVDDGDKFLRRLFSCICKFELG